MLAVATPVAFRVRESSPPPIGQESRPDVFWRPPAHVRRLVQIRRPSPEILRVVHYKLRSDLFLFSKECAVALDVVNAALARSAAGGARR